MNKNTANSIQSGLLNKLKPFIHHRLNTDLRAKKTLLSQKWAELPAELQTGNQLLGQHWVGCGYTMGPSYCSFGCSHCYLPKSSNRVPLVTLESMKEQIVAQRRILGAGGNLQITGGDVVDAYWREGRKDELIEILQFSVQNQLVPMLMTHGQLLLENPDYFARLVEEGGLRKVSIHIDITMAGRPSMPVGSLSSESQLNNLRNAFVDLVLNIRKQTGKRVVAAQTVTVTEKNIHSIGEILKWLVSDPKNLAVCKTISFQPEANVGRTRISKKPVTPELVWEEICKATGKNLARDHLLVGHPDCSSIATLLMNAGGKEIVYLSSRSDSGSKFWATLLDTFGGVGARSVSPVTSFMEKLFAIVKKPRIIPATIRYLINLSKSGEATMPFLWSFVTGRVKGLNIVMHNFMSAHDVQAPLSDTVKQRLGVCAFKGVIKVEGEWQAVSMCEMNLTQRPSIYKEISVRTN